MKKFVPVLVAFCCPMLVFCQDITGHWKGTIFNDDSKQSHEYEVVINKEKGKFSALSHTTYVIDGKKYFGIKKINIRIAKDGKVVMQDASLVDYNYPLSPNRNVLQLNVLDLAGQDKLEGLFVTNSSKDYKGLTGHVNIKRVGPIIEADLKTYFQKASNEQDLTAAK